MGKQEYKCFIWKASWKKKHLGCLRYRWEFNIIKADRTDRVMTALAEDRLLW
jgi:hypothetical protein